MFTKLEVGGGKLEGIFSVYDIKYSMGAFNLSEENIGKEHK